MASLSTPDLRGFIPADIASAITILEKNWDFGDFAISPASRTTAQYYLSKHLAQSNLGYVIAHQQRVLGLILGFIPQFNSNLDPVVTRSFYLKSLTTWEQQCTLEERTCWTKEWILPELKVKDVANHQHCLSPQASFLHLFAVDPDIQGLGLGSRLLNAFEVEHRQNNANEPILLQTDSWCSWAFYEHRGYQRLASVDIQEQEQIIGQYFLYGKNL